MNTIVIQTALTLEQEAVVQKLTNVGIYKNPDTNTEYKVGQYISNGEQLQIIVGRTNQTNINAAIETERIIRHFNPSYLFFLGVAGGLKDVCIGDVVIGTDVIGYERGKQKDIFLPRPQFGFASYSMEQSANSFVSSNKWQEMTLSLNNGKFNNHVKAFLGTIASGEKVVSSLESDLYQFLKTNCSHALAVEMEGLGFLEACRPYPLIKTLIVRGISDLIDGKAHADADGSQFYASINATEFLFGFLDFLEIKQSITPSTVRQKLLEICTKLYPTGLRENEIWRRAGGDLSLVNVHDTGKAQWVQALILLENGGGGNIDFKSLVNVMRSDFSNNESLKII